MERTSQPPLPSLGAEAVTQGLSVGRGVCEPCDRASLAQKQVPMPLGEQQATRTNRKGEIGENLPGSESRASIT